MKPQLPPIIGGVAKSIQKSAGRYHPDLQRTGLAVAAVVILSVLLSIHLLPSKVSLKLGDVSQENITARKFARYKDTAETELRISQAALSVGKAYDPVPNAADNSVRALKTVLNSVESIRADGRAVSTRQKVRELRSILGSSLGSRVTDTTFTVLLNIKQETLREIEDDTLRIVSEYMGTEIKEDPSDLRMVYSSIAAKSKTLASDPKIAATIKQLAQDCIQPNQIYNEERTLDLQEKARDSVQTRLQANKTW